MDIYTVSSFGHREVERAAEIESKLNQFFHDLITQKQYVEFLIGRDGEFDLLAASAIRRAIRLRQHVADPCAAIYESRVL